MNAIIIPCYNEGDRIDSHTIQTFLALRNDFKIILVNDGSKDNTLERLQAIKKESPDKIEVVDLKVNGGKAEAVRQGVLSALENPSFEYIGFLDADFSTTLEEFETITKFIRTNSYFKAVIGSRLMRSGAQIKRKLSRRVFSLVVRLLIRVVSRLSIKDTQCGAKIFHREMAKIAFKEAFITDWLFDVEIFIRFRKYFGKHATSKIIYEYPLMRWINPEGSKVSMKEIYRTPLMILKIDYYYNQAWTRYFRTS